MITLTFVPRVGGFVETVKKENQELLNEQSFSLVRFKKKSVEMQLPCLQRPSP